MAPQIFLLSPAHCGGRRAGQLLDPASELVAARRLAAGELTLGDAFQFMSGLYFRGKLAYARRFGRLRQGGQVSRVGRVGETGANPTHPTGHTCPIRPVYVITPTRGLRSPDEAIACDVIREFAAVDVEAGDPRYRTPLDLALAELAAVAELETRFVLLGSIATGKYVDALAAALGERLHFPLDFVGRGDMSRGGLLLRAVAAGLELPYVPLVHAESRHGRRPPKLEPLLRAPR